MTQKFLTVLIISLPSYLFGQSMYQNDSSYQRIVETECNDRIYSKMQVLPSLRIKKETFEESLGSYLKAKTGINKSGMLKFRFVVTTTSKILNIQKESGDPVYESILKDAILSLSDFWTPAKQNNASVCAFVSLEIFFQKDSLKVFITK